MSKACQYAMSETKVGVDMKEVSLKDVQIVLQKTIICINFFGKGRLE